MKATPYRDALLMQWRLMLLCVLAVGIGAALGSSAIAPLYQSSALLGLDVRLGPGVTNSNLILGSDKLIQTQARLATSQAVLAKVAAQTPGMSLARLTGEVTAAQAPTTELLQITVVDTNPERAAALANAIARALIDQQAQALQADNQRTQQQTVDALNAAQQQISVVSARLQAAQASAPGSAQAAQVASLKGQLATLQQQVTQYQAALTQMQVNAAQVDGSTLMHIAEPATPNLTPSQPNIVVMSLAGLALGVLLGLALVGLRQRLDRRIRSARELAELLGWPLLAEAPTSVAQRASGGITADDADLYQTIETSLAFAGLRTPLRSVAVLGASEGEGASALAGQLAYFLAEKGLKTLLVEADLYQPSRLIPTSARELTGFSAAALAFTTAAEGAATALSGYMYPAPSGSPAALRVIPTGPLPPQPGEMLVAQATRHLVGALATAGADLTLLAAPSLTKDGSARFAAFTDGVVVYVELGRAQRHALEGMRAQLTEAGAQVVGVVVGVARLGQASAAAVPPRIKVTQELVMRAPLAPTGVSAAPGAGVGVGVASSASGAMAAQRRSFTGR